MSHVPMLETPVPTGTRAIRVLLVSLALGPAMHAQMLTKGIVPTSRRAQDGIAAATQKQSLLQQMSGISVPFIENEGQSDRRVAFYASTFAGTVYVTRKGGIVYSLPSADGDARDRSRRGTGPARTVSGSGCSLTEAPVGASREARPAAQKPAQTEIDYFLGNDSSAWKSGIATYELEQPPARSHLSRFSAEPRIGTTLDQRPRRQGLGA